MPEYVEMFRALAIPSTQSDICRFAMLYELGGLYTDCHFGFEQADAVRKFLDHCQSRQVVVVENKLFRDVRPTEHHLLISGFMYAAARQELMLEALAIACDNLARHRAREKIEAQVPYDIWSLCGPWVLNVAAYANVVQDAPDPRFIAWDASQFPVVKPKYAAALHVVREEDLPVRRNMHKSYNKPGRHWSERQVLEPLFRV